jgi:ubiquinone/menaquinone biosynthesis C-methylase UbiE
MSTQDLTETRDSWDEIAAGYDQFVTPTHMWLGSQALRRAGLEAGMRFLDVAAGSGALSIPAALDGAEVTATDLSPEMLERLRARARAQGLDRVETGVMDGHALDLEDDTFDVAGSQYGVMLFPDLARALREMVRVTKPGGRVFLVVYGPPTQVEFLGFFLGAIQAVVPGFTGPPLDPPPLPFQVADAAKLGYALANAGLKDIQVETVTQRMEFQSGREMWNWVVNSNPIGAMLVADLTGEQERAVQLALDGMLRGRAKGTGPAILTDPNHIGIGTK